MSRKRVVIICRPLNSRVLRLRYIVLQGLSGSAAGFLTMVPLALYYVKLFVLGGSPRSVYKLKYGLRSVSFGTLFPTMTLLVVISKSCVESHNPPTHVARPLLYSHNILCHLSRHQRRGLVVVLPFLPVMEVPFPLADETAPF